MVVQASFESARVTTDRELRRCDPVTSNMIQREGEGGTRVTSKQKTQTVWPHVGHSGCTGGAKRIKKKYRVIFLGFCANTAGMATLAALRD